MKSTNVIQRGAKPRRSPRLSPLRSSPPARAITSARGRRRRSAAVQARRVAPRPPSPAAPADAAGRKVLYWHDPMVPGQRFDKPGKSPFMDMDLVPVYADAAPDGGVAISARQQQSFGVRTAAATEGTLDTGFSAVGAVGVDERALVAVQARSPGYVERLLVRAQYDGVAAGQPLAELYVPEWLAAQEELLALKASPQQDAARARRRGAAAAARCSACPTAKSRAIERDGKPSARVTVTAPQGGIVWEIGARDGMAVMPGTTLFKLAGLGTVWVIADVPEAQAALVRAGAPVEARAAAFPDRVFKGTVRHAAAGSERADAHGARADRPRESRRRTEARHVRDGHVRRRGARPAVLVPSEAVISTGKRNVVIVDAGDGRFAPVEVDVGREAGDVTEIRKRSRRRPARRRVRPVPGRLRSEPQGRAGANLGTGRHGRAGRRSGSARGTCDAGAAAATPATHKAEGVVRSVGDEVLIKHGAIPTAGMGAMTMAFKAPKGGVPKDVKEGTPVDVRVRVHAARRHAADVDRRRSRAAQEMIAALIRWSIANRFLVLLATVLARRRGRVGGADDAARRDSRPVRHAGDHPHDVPRAGAADRRGPGHLSADDDDALRARREDRARLLVLRRFVRLRAVRGRHRSLLGALARARIPEPGAGPAAGGREGRARPRRDRRRLDLRIRARRSHRQERSRAAARAAGLVPQVRAEDGARTSPRSRRSAAWSGSTRSSSIRRGCAPTTCRWRRWSRRSATRTARPAARWSSSPRPSTWCARAATSNRSTISARSRWSHPKAGTPVLLRDVARVQVGPEMRRGIAELDGEGEVAGGIVVLRSGKNAWETIEAVKAKLEQLKPGLPPGVEIVPVYDRSALIERAIDHLRDKLVEEFVVVALVCVVFLLHLRSALVAVVSLPLGVLAAFIVMRVQGVNANIMSLGGIAIADRRDGRRRDRDDRERAQEAGGVAARARERASTAGESTRSRRSTSAGRSSPTPRSRSARRCSSACSSSRCRSCRSSRWRRRKGGCSRRSRSPRPTRWPRPRCSR